MIENKFADATTTHSYDSTLNLASHTIYRKKR